MGTKHECGEVGREKAGASPLSACFLSAEGYNCCARMRFSFVITGCALLAGFAGPSQAAVPVLPVAQETQREETQQEQICRAFLQSVSDLWFLLSGISSQRDADAAAPKFSELVRRICLLDEQLSQSSTGTGLPVEVEAEVHENEEAAEAAGMLDALQLRILESFDDVNAEFLSLCRVRCYGSRNLSMAFAEAAATGMFAEDAVMLLRPSTAPLDDMETEQELVRLKRLEEPDRAVLDVLSQVKDAGSAAKAVATLKQISQRLHNLVPDDALDDRSFAEKYKSKVRAAFEPISPLLWGIRTELVRIASLPGYDSEPFDSFSDALNNVYDDLDATHRAWFDDVFDASFRSDLDDAIQESAPTEP